ncbi:MAG TPA: hypothetical protein VHK89_02875 [Actinomycetota bacterium]|nr:hypothetical protein [Actinomycetota bacterium]
MRRTLVLAALAALLAGACNAELSPGATVLQSIAATNDAGSARVAYSAVFDIAAADGPVGMSGEGIFDYAHQKGRMTFDMSQILRRAEGAPEGAGEVEMIFDGPVLYMRMPFLTELVAAERPWIRLDLDAARRAGRPDLAQLVQLGESDPTQLLELLHGAERGVDDVGTERVRGARTTHYRMTLDLLRAAEKATEGARASVDALIARSRTDALDADVWIDDEGRMRKMTYGVDLATSDGSADDNTMTVSMELYEFGVDVAVEPPPPDEVVDLLQLIDQPQGTP